MTTLVDGLVHGFPALDVDRPPRPRAARTAPAHLALGRPRKAPDHVPAAIAAEHPDASAVVAARRPRPPVSWVGVASHDPRRPSPARALLGALLCAGIAVAAPRVEAAAPPDRLARASEAPHPAAAVAACHGAAADPRQHPFWQLAPGACRTDGVDRPALWRIVELARDRAAAR